MRYGFVIPMGEAQAIVDLAVEAEAAGWDGVFTWDGIDVGYGTGEISDPWVVLGAIAARTERVRIGAILTPVARRRPWKLARETVTVDRLSGGRLIVPVGLGTLDDGGFGKVGEPTDVRVRAQRLDEGLDILTGLWSGEPFSYQGKHYQIEEMTFHPTPVQSPRIPIWVPGAWPRRRSMARAIRYDGVLSDLLNDDGSHGEVTPEVVREIRAYAAEHRTDPAPLDIIVEGRTPGDDPAQAAETVGAFAEAGATWWIEALWSPPNDLATVRERIHQGPPRVR